MRTNKAALILLFLLGGLGLTAAGCGPQGQYSEKPAPGPEGDYVTFAKILPSGTKVECVGWRHSGAQGEGAAIECFPVPTK
jgi:hypothetical protein